MLPRYHQKPVGSAGAASGDDAGAEQDSGSEEFETEEQDEPSSNKPVDELSTFREKWHQELKSSPQHTRHHDLKISKVSPQHVPHQTVQEEQVGTSQHVPETIEDKAKALFMKGVQYEQDGKLYEAVKFYRRAVQLVPDIETRLYEASKAKAQPVEVDFEALTLENSSPDVTEDDEEDDILMRFQRIFLRDRTVCHPDLTHNGSHLSSLPLEIILYIMKWVVSSELDLRALDLSCSAVCRGFYLATRDPEIWRLACVRVWGVNCGGLSNFESWRQMYIERPRVHFHGCYISKTTYIRHGEHSFQDQFYRPWHLVEYYRYLRFFPEGLVLMLTTPDDPAVCVRELKHRNSRNPTVLHGHYRLHDDHVTIVLKREADKAAAGNNKSRNQKRRDPLWTEASEQTFHLELQIASNRSHRHVQLLWQGYSVITVRGGTESSTKFDIISGRFPPFYFSRVKSYTSESESILQ